MSTNINISVDRGRLLNQNRQQTAANRQAHLDKERRQVVEQEGSDARDERLAQEGNRADGTTDNNPYTVAAVDSKTGAQRKRSKPIYFGPKYAPYSTTQIFPYRVDTTKYFLIDSSAKRGPGLGNQVLQANRWYYKTIDYAWDAAAGGEFAITEIEETGGPNEAPALVSRGNGQSIDVYSQTEIGSNTNTIGINRPAMTYECFIKLNNVNTTAFNTGALTLNILDADSYVEYINSNSNSVQNVPLSATVFDFASWTHLAIVWQSETYSIYIGGVLVLSISMPETIGYLKLGRLLFANTYTGLARLSVSSMRIVDRAVYREPFAPPAVIK